MNHQALMSVGIFAAAYLLIATEKINKTVVAVVGASLMVAVRLVPFEEAIQAVDFNVIFLLVGMMTTVSILSKTGFFEWTAISVAKLARGNPVLIMLFLLAIAAGFSAFLDNVTTIVLLVPVTILITQVLEISPIPFVILEAIASNIGGTATLIGDPPNIIIGSQGGLTFNDFLINLAPVIMLVFALFCATALPIFKNKIKVPADVRKRVDEAIPRLAIVDRRNMAVSLIVLGIMFTGFFLHNVLHLEPGVIALAGSMILMVLCGAESDETLMEVEWGVIFFFIGLFMMVSALESTGVITWIAKHLLKVGGHNLLLMCIVVLWASAFLSSVLDNIPFVMAMIPVLKMSFAPIAQSMNITDPAAIKTMISQPLWWSLALGVCLGGNGTLIGASANVVSVRICSKNKYHISFMAFTKYGILFMLESLIVCTAYIWLRYF